MKFARWFALTGTVLAIAPAMWIGSAYATQLSLAPRPIIRPAAPRLVPTSNQGPLLKRLSESVTKTRSALLWSVYPASVRGQVVLEVTPGGDPLLTGGW